MLAFESRPAFEYHHWMAINIKNSAGNNKVIET